MMISLMKELPRGIFVGTPTARGPTLAIEFRNTHAIKKDASKD